MVLQHPVSSTRTPYVPRLLQGEHVLLLGMTGSGKTVLAESFLSRQQWVVVIDLKQELKWRAFQVITDIRLALSCPAKSTLNRFIYRPNNASEAANAIDKLFRQGGWTIYVDEVYGLSVKGSSTSFPEPYIRALTRGRSRGITMWSGMQRPRFAPYAAFTESTHAFVFRLKHVADRIHVGQFLDPVFRDYNPPRYYFCYYDSITQTVRPSNPLRKDVR